MKMIAIIYLSIALLFSISVMLAEAGSHQKIMLKNQQDALAVGFMVLIWPITMVLIALLEIFELYKKKQAKRICDILVRHNKNSIDACISELNIKELQVLYHAHKIGATFLSPKSQKLVEQYLINKSFEKHFLEKNNDK